MKSSIFVFTIFIISLVSCIRKRDFDYDKIKWDDITPSWGLPLVNTRMTVADAINPLSSSVDIQIDNDGFITLVYLDTIVTPKGDALLYDAFKFPRSFNFNPAISFGERNLLPAAGSTLNLPPLSGFVPFELENSDVIKEVSLKEGKLNIRVSSDYRHDISFKLTLPDLKSKNNVPYAASLFLEYNTGASPVIRLAEPQNQDLTGYKLSAASGQQNKIAYTVSDISLKIKGDNPPTANPILSADSLKFDISLSEIKYNYVIGKFKPLFITDSLETGFLKGSTQIAAFKNTIAADLRFAEPSVEFNFRNSFGISPSISIDKAEMEYAYTPKQEFTTNNSPLKIPGITSVDKSNEIGAYASTSVILDKNTSNINFIVGGAPSKFTYNIPFISLSSGNDDAFISDNSQLEIYTKVKLPLYGAIRSFSINDTVKDVEMIKPENVDYIEFKIGSDNSIPLGVDLQAYFLDTAQLVIADGKVTYKILDSLISPPVSKAIVTAAGFDINDLSKTTVTHLDRIVPISKEKYYNISFCNMIMVKGTIMTPDAETRDVKFTTRQMFTYKLSVFAKLRVNPARISEDDLKTKK